MFVLKRFRAGLSLALLTTALSLSPAAHADGKVQDALKLLQEGIDYFKADKLDAAHTAFVKVVELVPDAPNPHRWLGLTEARLGDCKGAVTHLDKFLGLVPATDPRTVEAITVRDRCREDLEVKTGMLIIESRPTGAEVRLDREDSPALGTTPFKKPDVVVGSHVALLRLEGHERVSRVFTIHKNETVNLDVTMPVEKPVAVVPVVPVVPAPAPAPEAKKKSKLWVIGLVAGIVGASALGVGLGLGLSRNEPSEPVFPSVAGVQ